MSDGCYNRQVTKITDALLHDTIFKYSGAGCASCGGGVDKLTEVRDANQAIDPAKPGTSYTYDHLGRLDTETDPIGKKLRYTYYDSGLLKEKLDATTTPEQVLITYTYNNNGQLTKKHYADTSEVTFVYNAMGQLESAANQYITYTYAYYDDGKLRSVTDSNGRTISYDIYDGLGQRKQVTILAGSPDAQVLSYDYDNANRPWHITSPAGQFTFGYDPLGRRQSLSYPNQTIANYVYDDLNRLTTLSHSVVNGASFAAFTYTHDKVGNRQTKSGSANESYFYDLVYRLLTVTAGNPEGFSYDPVGNRQTGPGAKDTSYLYNTGNQLRKGRKLEYNYDNAGNQTDRAIAGVSDKSWTQSWDYENRLVKVEKIKGSEKRTVTFSYDPMGRRIGKQFTTIIDGVTKTSSWSYVYDDYNIILEVFTDDTGTVTKTFYTQGAGVDEHLVLERSGQFYYYHADGLGSVVSITDQSRNVVQSYGYDSFGMAKPSTSFANSYTYTGREWDRETGLYYYRARYYDPIDGHFISKDPIGFRGGINVYAYVQNNPVNRFDPFGLRDYTILDWPGETTPFTVYDFRKNMLWRFKEEYDKSGNSCWKKLMDNYSWPRATVDSFRFDVEEAIDYYRNKCFSCDKNIYNDIG